MPRASSERPPIRRPRAARRGFSLVEITVVLVIFATIGAYFAQTMIFASKSERATNKKVISARTLQYIQGRIRRDVKWARHIEVVDKDQQDARGARVGRTLKLHNLDKSETRIYSWDPVKKTMKIPDIANPKNQVEYGQSKFRLVVFYDTEGGGEGVRTVISPIPYDENEKITGAQEQLWGAAMVGRAETDPVSVTNRYVLFNEPAFGTAEKTKGLMSNPPPEVPADPVEEDD